MVTAVVLMNVNRSELGDVVNKLVEIDGVAEVYTVAGEFDLAVIIRVKDNARLSEIVVEKLPHHIKGILHTKTLIALKSHSRFDLEKIFFGK